MKDYPKEAERSVEGQKIHSDDDVKLIQASPKLGRDNSQEREVG